MWCQGIQVPVETIVPFISYWYEGGNTVIKWLLFKPVCSFKS